ncbi:two-component sensor histidine kinase [Flavonifractor sp. An92]|uniref:sensor histidine kinase n=1 Tax=Flavonifractor sp. An92 TaxID=1965666 RepID=UPI000B3664E4|nr:MULTISPECIES: HAMP domain-containing sensor histidine kinase [unclassified Flavonifractor]OUN08739.1 two-component sensor histidine kinase [Flavonifractor sp. An92]OUQ26393.1 two-component sensor histidine kinase [Flavonifractor sp. An135]
MIKELRRKFIFISGISIFLVFVGIFVLISAFSMAQMDRTMDTLTDAISSNDGVFPDFEPSDRPAPLFSDAEVITAETRFSTRFFMVWLDGKDEVTRMNTDAIASLSEDEVEEYAAQALEKGAQRGWVLEYRYKVTETDEGVAIVFVNGSSNQNITNRLLLTAFLVLFGSAVLILALTVILSKRAVRPVAESYEKQKQFITDANHELKTPLTLILSNLDIVESELGKNEWLDDIRSEGERMGLLINQLVALCRMDESESHLTLAPFDLSEAVSDTVSEFQTLAAERDQTLTARVEPGISYRGDEALVRRLAAILLDNAVKYCDPGGDIRVELFQRRHPVLVVENTYAQVDRLELDKLFDRFYRADPARTFTGGFGVGLSIAQSIARSHRGSIHVYRKKERIGFRAELK